MYLFDFFLPRGHRFIWHSYCNVEMERVLWEFRNHKRWKNWMPTGCCHFMLKWDIMKYCQKLVWKRPGISYLIHIMWWVIEYFRKENISCNCTISGSFHGSVWMLFSNDYLLDILFCKRICAWMMSVRVCWLVLKIHLYYTNITLQLTQTTPPTKHHHT